MSSFGIVYSYTGGISPTYFSLEKPTYYEGSMNTKGMCPQPIPAVDGHTDIPLGMIHNPQLRIEVGVLSSPLKGKIPRFIHHRKN